MVKNLVILGSTGSIGTQALEVVKNLGTLNVLGLSAGSNVQLLSEQIEAFSPEYIFLKENSVKNAKISDKGGKSKVSFLEGFKNPPKVIGSNEGLASLPKADIVLVALSGTEGLSATLAALKAGKTVALANKEALVAGGKFIKEAIKLYGGRLIPVDSEHSAIFQCLNGEKGNKIRRILLTASGGAFRDYSTRRLVNVKAADALKHPVWKMGKKVTIDSATLMNKGLELIEAMYLFDVPAKDVEIVLHRESIVHSMVEFADGAVMAQLANPDMRLAIQYALTYPKRVAGLTEPLDFKTLSSLSFGAPDEKRFPCLTLAKEAARLGGAAPAVLCAADDVAVEKYLAGEIGFYDIPKLISAAMEKFGEKNVDTVTDLYGIIEKVRKYTYTYTIN